MRLHVVVGSFILCSNNVTFIYVLHPSSLMTHEISQRLAMHFPLYFSYELTSPFSILPTQIVCHDPSGL